MEEIARSAVVIGLVSSNQGLLYRAVKVSFERRESAVSVLVGAKRLKEVADLRNVFDKTIGLINVDITRQVPRGASEKRAACRTAERVNKKATWDVSLHSEWQNSECREDTLQSANSPNSTSEHSN